MPSKECEKGLNSPCMPDIDEECRRCVAEHADKLPKDRAPSGQPGLNCYAPHGWLVEQTGFSQFFKDEHEADLGVDRCKELYPQHGEVTKTLLFKPGAEHKVNRAHLPRRITMENIMRKFEKGEPRTSCAPVERLVSCPFCGAEAETEFEGEPHVRTWGVVCNCTAGIELVHTSEEEAIEVWNKRAS